MEHPPLRGSTDADDPQRPSFIKTSAIAVAGDFNTDGELDLVVSNGSEAGVSLLLSGGPQESFDGPSIAFGGIPTAMVAGDLNADGETDLVIAQWESGTVLIFLGDGQGNLAQTSTLALGGTICGLTIGDFAGDGLPDLAVGRCDPAARHDSALLLLAGDERGGLTSISLMGWEEAHRVVSADLNGDGASDLIALDAAGRIIGIYPSTSKCSQGRQDDAD